MLAKLFVILIALPTVAFSGYERNGQGARAISLANAFVALSDNPWAVHYNPAGLTRILAVQGSAFFAPGQFGLKELQAVCIGAAFPLRGCAIGMLAEQFGSELYRETTASFAMGISVVQRVGLGAAITLNRISVESYGAAVRSMLDIGGMADVTDALRVGFCWKNITGTTVGQQAGQLPQVFNLGVCYETTQDSRITLELEKDLHYPFIKKLGFEQRFLGIVDLRLGLSDEPDRFSCGIGLLLSECELSYAGFSHAQLGWTHHLEVSISLSR